jgi:hypothetical protein
MVLIQKRNSTPVSSNNPKTNGKECRTPQKVADTKSRRARKAGSNGKEPSPMQNIMEDRELSPGGKVIYANGSIDFVLTSSSADPALKNALKFLRDAVRNRLELIDLSGCQFRVTQQITSEILERVAQAASVCTGKLFVVEKS